MENNKTKGNRGEDIAAQYLVDNQLKIIERNYRCKLGEIDIIAKDDDYIVFIEVKLRYNKSFGVAIEAVTPFKQRTIRKVAEFYLLTKRISTTPCRFDVIGIDIDLASGKRYITHVKNAF